MTRPLAARPLPAVLNLGEMLSDDGKLRLTSASVAKVVGRNGPLPQARQAVTPNIGGNLALSADGTTLSHAPIAVRATAGTIVHVVGMMMSGKARGAPPGRGIRAALQKGTDRNPGLRIAQAMIGAITIGAITIGTMTTGTTTAATSAMGRLKDSDASGRHRASGPPIRASDC